MMSNSIAYDLVQVQNEGSGALFLVLEVSNHHQYSIANQAMGLAQVVEECLQFHHLHCCQQKNDRWRMGSNVMILLHNCAHHSLAAFAWRSLGLQCQAPGRKMIRQKMQVWTAQS